MIDYNFRVIEKKWQTYWEEKNTYKVEIDKNKPKFYVLDMFPYPSGAGLHVGHPLGYIASDIYSRYKRLKGFNVLHPMGYDAFGLPAEQYAIQTGQHPAVTTEQNIKRYRGQLDKLGFSFDWSREVRTCDPFYYKWTQWTFIQLYKSWYNNKTNKAENIDNLIKEFEKNGNQFIDTLSASIEKESGVKHFSASVWKNMNEKQQQEVLMNYRLAYLSESMVNWCPELGTVLANDEVAGGFSVRGGHPIERKLMKQWFLRITAYAERLLSGLDTVDWSESLKEMQRNWIGRSEGATVYFDIKGFDGKLEIFTTRPDTLFGCTFMVLAPEHKIIEKITPPEFRESVMNYVTVAKNRSERERQADVKTVSGVFTGAYCNHPFIKDKIVPIWVADYVLAGYGSGAIMAVPAHDSRDFAFAKHFSLPIIQVVADSEPQTPNSELNESYDAKEGTMVNSGFINEMDVKEAIRETIKHIEENKIGFRTVNYRLRDAIFSRQRYWGEPFPVYYKDNIPYTLDESELPLELPEVDKYLPTETGEPPLARAKNWKTKEGYPLETNTMPGFAGSSAYYLRYMDPHNDKEYFSKEANKYWENVDLYIGGAEHATGHLIYSRFWNKFLYDLGLCVKDEPFKKLINQGMIQGVSMKANIITLRNVPPDGKDKFYILPFQFKNKEHRAGSIRVINIDINFVDGKNRLTKENLTKLKLNNSNFIDYEIASFENFKQILLEVIGLNEDDINRDYDSNDFNENSVELGPEVEKMSKSKYNVVNPDELIEKYGADTLRLYEMFLGPLEQHKPWDTNGIEGVFRFMKKLWRLFHDNDTNFKVSDETPSKEELKTLHKTIKKVQEDIERYSFNTGVSTFMICVNELSDLKCNKRAILEPLTILLSPYAPHIAEELWSLLGFKESITKAEFPSFNEEYLKESNFSYSVSFNGKMRFTLELQIDLPVSEIEKAALAAEQSQKWLEGKTPKKIIIVPKKIINIVI